MAEPAPLLSVEDHAVAESIVAWLATHDIAAEVRDGGHTDSTGLAAIGGSPSMREVWLLDEGQRQRAADLMQEEARRLQEERINQPEYDIRLECERCGAGMVFSSRLRGTVQECPECAEFVDVPDDEEDDFDYGEPEDEEGA